MSTKEQKHEQPKHEAVKKGPDDWRTRINWERIYKTLAYIIIALVPFFIRDMFFFREEVVSLGHAVMPWDFLWWGLVSTVIFTIVRKGFFMATHNFIYSKILPQYQGEERVLHTRKVQKWVFDFFYYSATTIFSYYAFSDAPFYPLSFKHLEDESRGLFINWPSLPVNEPYYKWFTGYLIVQFGHHIWGLLDLVIVRRKIENRYNEWLLHHLLAFTLIFYSAYFNFHLIAISVLIVHDIGDIFIVMFKTCGEWKSKGIIFKYLVFQMISGWFLSRVYLFPKVVIWPIIQYRKTWPTEEANFSNFQIHSQASYIYQTLLLMCLYFLHLYWFAQMITLLASYISKGLKEGRSKKNKETGYGNEWDYHHYNPKDKKENKKQQ